MKQYFAVQHKIPCAAASNRRASKSLKTLINRAIGLSVGKAEKPDFQTFIPEIMSLKKQDSLVSRIAHDHTPFP